MDKSPCLSIHRLSDSLFTHPHQRIRPLDLSRESSPKREQLDQKSTLLITVNRKRKQDENEEDMDSSLDFPTQQRKMIMPKRIRTDDHRRFPLSKLLDTMDKPQLVSLLTKLIESNSSIQADVASHIPRPTLASAQTILANLETKLQATFPYTKWGPSRDDYSFNRIRPILEDLVETTLDLAAHFCGVDEHASTAFAYLHHATSLAHRLPRWENEMHEKLRLDLYSRLEKFWKKAILEAGHRAVDQGRIYGASAVTEWAKNLVSHDQESEGAFGDAVRLFVDKLGWIVGITDLPVVQRDVVAPAPVHVQMPMGLFSNS